jgi:hypothetical protein
MHAVLEGGPIFDWINVKGPTPIEESALLVEELIEIGGVKIEDATPEGKMVALGQHRDGVNLQGVNLAQGLADAFNATPTARGPKTLTA